MGLTDMTCRTAKAKENPYKLTDAGGLYLFVRPSGTRSWQMHYRFLRKQKVLSFGPYPLVTLQEARNQRDMAKRLLLQNIDPGAHKKKEHQSRLRNQKNTFKALALEWHEKQASEWSPKHADGVLKRMEVDLFPFIGNRPIADISAPDLLDVLKKIEKRGALDIAARVRQISGQIFRYGIQRGLCTQNPVPALQGALKTRRTKHFAALDIQDIPELLSALNRNEARLFSRTQRAIKLSLLTFTRPGELRQARWDEINFKEAEWRIPAAKMKMRRDHIVPLSKQAIEILKEQKDETGHYNSPWVFPSTVRPAEPMSNGTVLVALKRMGFEGRMTAHGFRALARTTIREKLDYDPDVIECQLAHKAAGPLGEAYNRAQFLDKRKKMMTDWAEYLDRIA